VGDAEPERGVTGRAFDLDDSCTEVVEHERGERPCDERRRLDDLDPLKRQRPARRPHVRAGALDIHGRTIDETDINVGELHTRQA
jgi:hypothetical protein